jgi:hypothetical protein
MSRIEAQAEEVKQAHDNSHSLKLDVAVSQLLTEIFQQITELDMCLESGNPEHDSYHDRKLRVMREVQRMILGNDELETFVQELTAQR